MKLRPGVFVPTLIAAIAALAVGAIRSQVPVRTQVESTAVKQGRDYYVAIVLLELEETNLEGASWDEYNGTAPDPFYEVYWRGTRVFKSPVREDSLLAKWSNLELDLADLALKGGKTSIDSLVKAARISVQSGEGLEFRIYDSDLVTHELIGEENFSTTDLRVGDTTYDYQNSPIKRIILRVADLATTPDITK